MEDGAELNVELCSCKDRDFRGSAGDSMLEVIFGVVDRVETSVAVDGLLWGVDLDAKYRVRVFATLYGPTLNCN